MSSPLPGKGRGTATSSPAIAYASVAGGAVLTTSDLPGVAAPRRAGGAKAPPAGITAAARR